MLPAEIAIYPHKIISVAIHVALMRRYVSHNLFSYTMTQLDQTERLSFYDFNFPFRPKPPKSLNLKILILQPVNSHVKGIRTRSGASIGGGLLSRPLSPCYGRERLC